MSGILQKMLDYVDIKFDEISRHKYAVDTEISDQMRDDYKTYAVVANSIKLIFFCMKTIIRITILII